MPARADRDLTAHQRGYDSRWQEARQTFLRQRPLCECDECKRLGRIRAATIVDHKVPPRMADAIRSGSKEAIAKARQIFWDKSNWQPLSKSCHDSWKQRLEKSGTVAGCTADGMPLDPNHHWNLQP